MEKAREEQKMGEKTIEKNAFVQLVLQENRYPIQSKPLTMQLSHTVPNKTNDPIAVSANPTKEKAKHHVAAGTNDLSPQ